MPTEVVIGAQVKTITPEQLAERLDIGLRSAYALIREMRHTTHGRQVWTTEEWLAEWLAAESVPSMNWPKPGQSYDPLEEVLVGRVVQMVGELAARGKIMVLPTGGVFNHG